MRPATASSSAHQKLRELKEWSEKPPEKTVQISIRHDPLKRAFDIAFSALVIIASSPLLFLLAFLVRLTSEGPIFYKSRRLGRGGKIIECWKFRTMYRDAEVRLRHLLQGDAGLRTEWEAFQKLKDDPRTTPLGRFLRKTSLDEFPQFWNVLKGDLSVVGPRPPTLLGPVDHFLQEIRLTYRESTEKILSIRPGITGIWQISGRSQISLEERRKLEERYAENRTFGQDLLLIAKTIPAVLFSRGAF